MVQHRRNITQHVDEKWSHEDTMDLIDAANMFAEVGDEVASQEWSSRDQLVKFLLKDYIPRKYHKKFKEEVIIWTENIDEARYFKSLESDGSLIKFKINENFNDPNPTSFSHTDPEGIQRVLYVQLLTPLIIQFIAYTDDALKHVYMENGRIRIFNIHPDSFIHVAENSADATLTSIGGMGAVTMPGSPMDQGQYDDQEEGSGDIAHPAACDCADCQEAHDEDCGCGNCVTSRKENYYINPQSPRESLKVHEDWDIDPDLTDVYDIQKVNRRHLGVFLDYLNMEDISYDLDGPEDYLALDVTELPAIWQKKMKRWGFYPTNESNSISENTHFKHMAMLCDMRFVEDDDSIGEDYYPGPYVDGLSDEWLVFIPLNGDTGTEIMDFENSAFGVFSDEEYDRLAPYDRVDNYTTSLSFSSMKTAIKYKKKLLKIKDGDYRSSKMKSLFRWEKKHAIKKSINEAISVKRIQTIIMGFLFKKNPRAVVAFTKKITGKAGKYIKAYQVEVRKIINDARQDGIDHDELLDKVDDINSKFDELDSQVGKFFDTSKYFD